MNARLALAGLALLAFGAAAAMMLRRPAPGERTGLAPPFRAGAFDTIEVEKGEARTTVRRQAGGYWVTAPVTYAAEPAGAAAAFQAIENLDPGAVVTTRPRRYAELQVDGATGIGVRVLMGDRRRLDLVIGKKVGDGTFVRLRAGSASAVDGDAVWQVNGDLRVLFDKRPSDWRDRSVTTFNADEAREIAIDARDREQIRLRKLAAGDGGAGGWAVVQSTREIPELDPLVPKELLKAMASLKASEFADGTTLAAAGLDRPALTITVTLGGGEKDIVLVGNASGADEFFVKTSEGPQVFLVKGFDVERFARRPIQFRNKLLCHLSDADISEIAVTNGVDSYRLIKDGAAWRATSPRGFRVDPEKVAAFSSIFRGWRAPRIAEDPPAGLGGAPLVVITGRGSKGSCTVAALALSKGEDAYYAKAPPSQEIFVLPRWMIDRVAVPLQQIRAR